MIWASLCLPLLLLTAQNFAVAAAAWLCQASSSPVSVSQVCTHHKTHMSHTHTHTHTNIYIQYFYFYFYFILFIYLFIFCELPIWSIFWELFFVKHFKENYIFVVIYFNLKLLKSLHSGCSLSIGSSDYLRIYSPKVEKSNDP